MEAAVLLDFPVYLKYRRKDEIRESQSSIVISCTDSSKTGVVLDCIDS